jgi:hypothetical protein
MSLCISGFGFPRERLCAWGCFCGCHAGIKKGPRRPCDQRIASFADGLPAPGDAPPKYDNKISHGGLARLLSFVANLTPSRADVKLFPAAGNFKFFAIVDRGPASGVTPVIKHGSLQEAALATPSKEARERAEQKFKKKEIEARDASKAMAEYQASLVAQREKTARLRALREAKEAAERAARRTAQASADAGEGGRAANSRGKTPARA